MAQNLGLDFLQGASNAVASNVSGPVDLLAFALRKMGFPVPEDPVLGAKWMADRGITAQTQNKVAGMLGETAGLVAPIAAAARAPSIAANLVKHGEQFQAYNKALGPAGSSNVAPWGGWSQAFDPRFDPRVLEQGKLQSLRTTVDPRQMQPAPTLSLADLGGTPFITSMADRTAAGGLLTGINDVKLSRPVDLKGGQDFMFDNPGQVLASAKNPVNQIMELAGDVKRVTGKDPLFLPWRMAPTGGDFAAMTGETMLSYAKETLGKRDTAKLDKAVRQYIPDWAGVASDASVKQFRDAPDSVRKALKNMLDVEFRGRGGLNIGEARLAVADPKQLTGADGGLMNVGRIHTDKAVIRDSGHPSYPLGVPGEGMGRLDRPFNVFELMPSVVSARQIPNAAAPRTTDLRALQMKPYAGVISDSLLKSLGY
jgi:hypothetical protein